MHLTKLESSQGHKDGSIYTNQLLWCTTLKKNDKNHMIISIDVVKAFAKNSTSIHDKNSYQSG